MVGMMYSKIYWITCVSPSFLGRSSTDVATHSLIFARSPRGFLMDELELQWCGVGQGPWEKHAGTHGPMQPHSSCNSELTNSKESFDFWISIRARKPTYPYQTVYFWLSRIMAISFRLLLRSYASIEYVHVKAIFSLSGFFMVCLCADLSLHGANKEHNLECTP